MRYLLALILPPVAVLISGRPVSAVLNIFLTLFFWLPGAIHALLVVSQDAAEERNRELMTAVTGKAIPRKAKPEMRALIGGGLVLFWVAIAAFVLTTYFPGVTLKLGTVEVQSNFPALSKSAERPPSSDILPGLAPVDLYGNLESKGFTINKDIQSHVSTFTCLKVDDWSTLSAIARSPAGRVSEVSHIEAAAETTITSGSIAEEFLGYICTLPYKGSNPAAARAWLVKSFGSPATLTLGNVRFDLTQPAPNNHHLRLTPIPAEATLDHLPALEGWTMAEVTSKHGPPLSTDKTTGIAIWSTFSATFTSGQVTEINPAP